MNIILPLSMSKSQHRTFFGHVHCTHTSKSSKTCSIYFHILPNFDCLFVFVLYHLKALCINKRLIYKHPNPNSHNELGEITCMVEVRGIEPLSRVLTGKGTTSVSSEKCPLNYSRSRGKPKVSN